MSIRRTVYLDCAATAPLRAEALAAMQSALAIGANPSSVHAGGRAARAVIERARVTVAAFAGAAGAGLVFTSGATESNALAIASATAGGGTSSLIVGAIEHDSVAAAATASGLRVAWIPVDAQGLYDLDWLEGRLARGDLGRPFVAMMAANNETGVLQPIADAAAVVARVGGWLHVDAVQVAGRAPLDFHASGAETMAISAHKLGGPHGVGALIHRRATPLRASLVGGGQEQGLRAGAENLAGIAGFAAAAAAADPSPTAAQAAARVAEARLASVGATIAGVGAARLADFVALATPEWRSDLQVMALDLEGVSVSAGAACSSGKVKPSRVLAAMGFGALADGALRASGGWSTTPEDWNDFTEVWLEAHARHAERRRVREYD